jgi:hypothetical protein
MVMGLSLALAGGATACGNSKIPELGGPDGGGEVSRADAGARVDVVAVGGVGAKPSVGCGVIPEQAFGRYVQHMEAVSVAPAYATTYTNRIYYVRVPANYDPGRAYPTVFLGPGCGESGQSPLPVQTASMDDAILVGLNGIDNCFNKDAADTPELPYFDATLAAVEGSLCVDQSRIFVAGFSSGSWLTSFLGCARGDFIRAQGSIGGGFPPSPACTGPIAAMYVSDTDDTKNTPAMVMLALQRVLTANGCGTETEPYDVGVTSPCLQYKGCMSGYPVVWCLTSGVGHADQSTTKISTIGFWHFWTSLP